MPSTKVTSGLRSTLKVSWLQAQACCEPGTGGSQAAVYSEMGVELCTEGGCKNFFCKVGVEGGGWELAAKFSLAPSAPWQ